jgi:hypothetical protein
MPMGYFIGARYILLEWIRKGRRPEVRQNRLFWTEHPPNPEFDAEEYDDLPGRL